MNPRVLLVHAREVAGDLRGARVERAARAFGLEPGRVAFVRVYVVAAEVAPEPLWRAARSVLVDPILEEVTVDSVTPRAASAATYVLVSRRPGVTDDEGRTAQSVLASVMDDAPFEAHGEGEGEDEQVVFAQSLYLFEQEVPIADLERFGREVLGNPLVDRIDVGAFPPHEYPAPRVAMASTRESRTVSLARPDEALGVLSIENSWHLSIAELRAIRDHFEAIAPARAALGLPTDPTQCELEVFAQTWSEHCKHKEFKARIHMTHEGRTHVVDSLFRTFIERATSEVRERYRARGEDWLVTVFSDNAGVVHLDADRLFVLKVETHNSPSALDPVGGAMTGVLGNNRDAFGTGKGGARLLFNTNVLCLGPRDYAEQLGPLQMHPARIADGVVSGIEQAGNHCGVPTVNGAIVFDARYAGKPLVHCGTGAVLPARYPNGPAWEKVLAEGDRIVVVGGRVGQDGIHGATFSSAELAENTPRTVVQIGSPFTQKLVADFMEEACALGLVAGTTDNGAGGLSSSIGELAIATGGARVELSRVPLKYQGLEPWEIFLSESQERMTLAVRPEHVEALSELARRREVPLADIGEFTADGVLDVRHEGDVVARLDLAFLHDGCPRKELWAEWSAPAAREPVGPGEDLDAELDLERDLLALLASPNVRSREDVIRRFDHEVKGKTIVKSLMGERGIAPQDAAVVRVSFDSYLGIAVASGICPKFGDLDPYEMSAGAFDEALRSLVSVGARLPVPGEAPSWSGCDNFCVPDSAYHPDTNPDGKLKLGKLVRMCEALYDMSTFFDVPMTSGKDSMKNDLRAGDRKISVPPTVLFTLVARMPDVRAAITSEFKAPGDVVYLVGRTYDELGASELYRLRGVLGANVPRVRKADAKRTYLALMQAHCARLVASSHDLSDGGLAVAVAECCIGSGLGAELTLAGAALTLTAQLFAESHARLVVSVAPGDAAAFEAALGSDARRLGVVTAEPALVLRAGTSGRSLGALPVARLEHAWRDAGVLA